MTPPRRVDAAEKDSFSCLFLRKGTKSKEEHLFFGKSLLNGFCRLTHAALRHWGGEAVSDTSKLKVTALTLGSWQNLSETGPVRMQPGDAFLHTVNHGAETFYDQKNHGAQSYFPFENHGADTFSGARETTGRRLFWKQDDGAYTFLPCLLFSCLQYLVHILEYEFSLYL